VQYYLSLKKEHLSLLINLFKKNDFINIIIKIKILEHDHNIIKFNYPNALD